MLPGSGRSDEVINLCLLPPGVSVAQPCPRPRPAPHWAAEDRGRGGGAPSPGLQARHPCQGSYCASDPHRGFAGQNASVGLSRDGASPGPWGGTCGTARTREGCRCNQPCAPPRASCLRGRKTPFLRMGLATEWIGEVEDMLLVG